MTRINPKRERDAVVSLHEQTRSAAEGATKAGELLHRGGSIDQRNCREGGGRARHEAFSILVYLDTPPERPEAAPISRLRYAGLTARSHATE